MADPITPVITVTPGPAPDNSVHSSDAAFARMRTELAQANTDKAAAEEKLKTAERAKLDELERAKAELADLTKKTVDLTAQAARATEYEGHFENLYKQELAGVAEDRRGKIEKLTTAGTWPERLNALREAKDLLGTGPPPPAGTTTNPGSFTPPITPGTPPPGEPKKPATAAELRNLSFNQALTSRGPAKEAVLGGEQIDALMKRIESTIDERLAAKK